jgi:hypothetical protein
MPKQLIIFILVVFMVHLVVFFRLTLRHKRSDFLLATIAFLSLVLSTALRLWWPGIGLGGHELHAWLRVLAWCATAAAAFIFIKNKIKLRKV